jgi:cytochrome c biogenesis protein CcdA/thiol-disulfide isomerase/thioredoxin
MVVLIGIGFLAGLVTALSPCVLPVLPIVLAGGATGRRPLRIVIGLVASFTVFTLGAAWLLDLLGLPQDLLRNLAIALLFAVAASQLFPQIGEWLALPLTRLARRPAGELGGGLLLGASLGLVFVPCAGPVLAAVTVLSATHKVGFGAILLTLSYALGLALPLLAIATAGRGAAARLRSNAVWVRRVSGVTIAAAAVAIAFGADRHLQTLVPGYTDYFQTHVEASHAASNELQKLTGAHPVTDRANAKPGSASEGTLPDYGVAPDFAGVTTWLNSKPLTLRSLRGKVVLIDFWTYSCINCLRTLPHVKSWATTYGPAGLVVVGVHTPEFAFEHVVANVRSNADRLGIRYPIAVDNDYGTWSAWGNRYWPAEYLIDRQGHVREAHFGEGEYEETEASIRQLLGTGATPLPVATRLADPTPSGALTDETYLGFERIARYGGSALVRGRQHTYTLPAHLAADSLAYGGRWTVGAQKIVAGSDARIQLRYTARSVYIVLGGTGTMTVRAHGGVLRTVHVAGDRLYTAVRNPQRKSDELELRFSPGIQAYSFTFG